MLFIFDDYCGLWVRHFFKSGRSTLWDHVFYSFSIHHARDVIKMGFKVAYQKTKTDLLLKIVKYFWFLNFHFLRDPLFWSIYIADYYEHMFVTKKYLTNLKSRNYQFLNFFLKWRHSDRKWSKVVPRMTEWANDHFWSYFRQKTYSWGILNWLLRNSEIKTCVYT